jgi:hypothetical protein
VPAAGDRACFSFQPVKTIPRAARYFASGSISATRIVDLLSNSRRFPSRITAEGKGLHRFFVQ